MKSLYESILSSNGAGMTTKVIEWLKSCYANIIDINSPNVQITCSLNKGRYDINIELLNRHYLSSTVVINQESVNAMPAPIGKIYIDNNECGISITCKELKSCKLLPTNKYIRFIGVHIEDMSDLPKEVEDVEFMAAHSLGGRNECIIDKCNGIKLKSWLSDGCGYKIDIDNFKNNTIKDFCLSGLTMSDVDISVLGKMEKLLNNNHIDYKDITYFPYFYNKAPSINRGRIDKVKKRDIDNKVYDSYKYTRDQKRHPEISNSASNF